MSSLSREVTRFASTLFVKGALMAGYAIAFGAFQLAAGLWMRRVAAPQFAPTIQARWNVARHT